MNSIEKHGFLIAIAPDAGLVIEQLSYCDLLIESWQFGKVLSHGLIQRQLALFNQTHDDGAGYWF